MPKKTSIEDAVKYLLGKKIKHIRYMSEKEQIRMNWPTRPVVIKLEDQSIIFPSKEGTLHGQTKEGKPFTLLIT